MFKLFKDETRCYNGGAQHKYEAIFEIRPNYALLSGFEGTIHAAESLLNLTKRKVYLGHACRWCGNTVTNLKEPSHA